MTAETGVTDTTAETMRRDFDGLLIEDTPGVPRLIEELLRETEEPLERTGVDERDDDGF